MKTKKEDKMLRELFRHRLEGVELIPSPDAGDKLFRKLGRKEFFHFNPSRFNVWYAGVIAATCAAALIFFLSREEEDNLSMPATVIPDMVETGPSVTLETVPDLTRVQDPDFVADEADQVEIEETDTGENDSVHFVPEVNGTKTDIPPRPEINSTAGTGNVIPEPVPDSGKLRSAPQAKGTISASSVEGCCPLKVTFEPGTASFDHCRWTFGDGGVSEETNPEWIFDMEGVYTVTLHTYVSGEIHTASECTITVYPKPVARFEIIQAEPGVAEKGIRLVNFSTDAVKYMWEFGDGNISDLFEPVHIYSEPGDYTVKLVVTSAEGCTDTATFMNPFKGSDNFIEFPNAFLPGLDGTSGGYYSSSSDDAANVFHPVTSGVSEYQLRIFSKSGILIFESNDINIGWDGYYRNQLCRSGVYIWKVRGRFTNGEPFIKMGDLTLLKNDSIK